MKKAPSSMGRSLSSRYHPSSVKRQHSTEQMLLTLTRLTPFPNSCYWPSETGLEGELHVVVLACDFQPISHFFPSASLLSLSMPFAYWNYSILLFKILQVRRFSKLTRKRAYASSQLCQICWTSSLSSSISMSFSMFFMDSSFSSFT